MWDKQVDIYDRTVTHSSRNSSAQTSVRLLSERETSGEWPVGGG